MPSAEQYDSVIRRLGLEEEGKDMGGWGGGEMKLTLRVLVSVVSLSSHYDSSV